MQFDRYQAGIPRKVAIGGQDGQLSTNRDCTDQEVDRGSLNPLGSTMIEECGRLFMICGFCREVDETKQVIAKRLELLCIFDSRQEFLADKTKHDDPAFADQLCKLKYGRSTRNFGSAKGQRPNRCVDDNVHER